LNCLTCEEYFNVEQETRHTEMFDLDTLEAHLIQSNHKYSVQINLKSHALDIFEITCDSTIEDLCKQISIRVCPRLPNELTLNIINIPTKGKYIFTFLKYF